MKKRLAALLTALILLAGIGSASAESKTEEKPAEVILYCVQIPESKDGAVGVFCIDKAGILWGTAESDLKPDCGEEDVLQMIRERRGMQKMENLFLRMYDGTVMTESWFSDLAAMADDVPTAEGTPTQTGMYDSHTAIYAVRHLGEGNTESVLLGMCGSMLFENQSPDAQALYLFMWRQLSEKSNTFHPPYGYAEEGAAPHGFEMISVREFFGLEQADAVSVVIRKQMTDCEEGLIDMEMTEQDREKAQALLERGVIIGKVNSLEVTGGTMCYCFYDAQGGYLGRIETYGDGRLAVGNDGMYRLSLLPESMDNLTAEEIRLLTVKIEGVEYILGISTPRDFIRNGWKCKITRYASMYMTGVNDDKAFFIDTEGGGLDEPVRRISLDTEPENRPEYCSFDGIIDPDDPEDPDAVWLKKAEEAEEAEETENSGTDGVERETPVRPWKGFCYWMKTAGIGEVEESPDEDDWWIKVYVELGNGRRLLIKGREWWPMALELLDPVTEEEDPD